MCQKRNSKCAWCLHSIKITSHDRSRDLSDAADSPCETVSLALPRSWVFSSLLLDPSYFLHDGRGASAWGGRPSSSSCSRAAHTGPGCASCAVATCGGRGSRSPTCRGSRRRRTARSHSRNTLCHGCASGIGTGMRGERYRAACWLLSRPSAAAHWACESWCQHLSDCCGTSLSRG